MKNIGRILCVWLAVPLAHAQLAPASAPTPAQLARYDLNKNGRLDPEERARWQAGEASAAAVPVGTSAPNEAAVQLSPFEVREANNGYYAANTMSGTRLNTRIEDLGSSITVVTKEQMKDFAMLDINDIFNYESGTEGTGNYTAFEVDRNGMVADQIQNNPQGANRVRGVGPANIALNNFATSGRVPIDPINIDSVEISRGPNSNIFGLGEGSGTVNLIASSANLNRQSATAELRFDDIGGWRTSLDVNRPLVKGKLALRLSGVYQHDAFRRKPSGLETRRFNAILRAQPFKHTSVRASFQSYHSVGTRPRQLPRPGGLHFRFWHIHESVGAATRPAPAARVCGGAADQVAAAALPREYDLRQPGLRASGAAQVEFREPDGPAFHARVLPLLSRRQPRSKRRSRADGLCHGGLSVPLVQRRDQPVGDGSGAARRRGDAGRLGGQLLVSKPDQDTRRRAAERVPEGSGDRDARQADRRKLQQVRAAVGAEAQRLRVRFRCDERLGARLGAARRRHDHEGRGGEAAALAEPALQPLRQLQARDPCDQHHAAGSAESDLAGQGLRVLAQSLGWQTVFPREQIRDRAGEVARGAERVSPGFCPPRLPG